MPSQIFPEHTSKDPDRVAAGERPRACPRCGESVPSRGTGRPATWCSPACRRAAYEERRAARTGAIAIQVVERVLTVEHGLPVCGARVTDSPAACRKVLRALEVLAREGVLATDPKWDATVTAVRALNHAIEEVTRPRPARWR